LLSCTISNFMAKHILSFAFLFLLCQTGRASAVCEGDQSESGTCINDDSDAPAFVQAKIRRHPVAPSIDGNYTNKLAHVMITALNGDMLPFANKTVCKAAYPFLLDAIVATEVNFNTTTLVGIADSVVLGSDVVLHLEGLPNTYWFMSSGVGEHLESLNIFRITFVINSDKSHTTMVMAASPSGTESCVFTNCEWNPITSNCDGFNFNLTKLLVPP